MNAAKFETAFAAVPTNPVGARLAGEGVLMNAARLETAFDAVRDPTGHLSNVPFAGNSLVYSV